MMGLCKMFSMCWCCPRKESHQEEEGILPPAGSPSTPDSNTAEEESMGQTASKIKSFFTPRKVSVLETDGPSSNAIIHEPTREETFEPLASPRSALVRDRGSLTPPDTPILPPLKRLKEDDLQYMNFPVLRDTTSVEYVQRNKLMVILKGLPGSGKSRLSRNLQKMYPDAIICSADHYFIIDGEYKFDPEKLKYAHEACQKKARQAARRNCHVIVIDNTNVRNWESAVYLQMARKYNYFVLFMEPQTPWCFDAHRLAELNSHGVKEDIIAKKLKSYQEVLPMYYAWFFNEADSEQITKIARQWFEKALLEIEDCLEDFKQITELNTIEEILDYYTNENPVLHVTAKFTGRGKPPGSLDYINDPRVKESMGHFFPISNIGYVITPYTFGARVQLNDEELELWGGNDHEHRPDNLFKGGNFNQTQKNQESDENEDDSDNTSNVLDLCEQRIIIVDQTDTENRFWPTSGKGSRSHITLGCAPGVKPVTTGFDLIDIIECEQKCKEKGGSNFHNENAMDVDGDNDCDYPTYNFSGAVMKFYGEGRWVIYPETKVIAESIFSAFY